MGCCEDILGTLCKGFEKVLIGDIIGALLEGCKNIFKGVIRKLLELYEEIVGVLWEHYESVVGTLSNGYNRGLCHLAGVV